MDLIFRAIRAAVFALIMFFSLTYMGIPLSVAFTISLIPLVLGLVNVMTGFAVSLTALVFVVACFSSLVASFNIPFAEITTLAANAINKAKSTATAAANTNANRPDQHTKPSGLASTSTAKQAIKNTPPTPSQSSTSP